MYSHLYNRILHQIPSLTFLLRSLLCQEKKEKKKRKQKLIPPLSLPTIKPNRLPRWKKKSLNIDSFPRTISFLTKMASSSRNRIADTGLTRPFDRGSEASDRQEAAKKADKNVPRIDAQRFRMLLEMAK